MIVRTGRYRGRNRSVFDREGHSENRRAWASYRTKVANKKRQRRNRPRFRLPRRLYKDFAEMDKHFESIEHLRFGPLWCTHVHRIG